MALGNAGVAEFGRGNTMGLFEVEVALAGEVRCQAHIGKCKLTHDVSAQAAARATWYAGHRVPDGQVQACQARQELLAGC